VNRRSQRHPFPNLYFDLTFRTVAFTFVPFFFVYLETACTFAGFFLVPLPTRAPARNGKRGSGIGKIFGSCRFVPTCSSREQFANSEYTPWDYSRQSISIDLLAQRPRKAARKQIQPEIGPEKAFGQALREIRKTKEVSQEQLGLDAGFDRTYISLVERGINSPTIRTVVKLAGVLKIAPSKIVVRMEELMVRVKE
jgi:DNA-binding XRE family transcriptional regulator